MLAYSFRPVGGTGAHRTVDELARYSVFTSPVARRRLDHPDSARFGSRVLRTFRRLVNRLGMRSISDELSWPDAYSAWPLDATRVRYAPFAATARRRCTTLYGPRDAGPSRGRWTP